MLPDKMSVRTFADGKVRSMLGFSERYLTFLFHGRTGQRAYPRMLGLQGGSFASNLDPISHTSRCQRWE